MTNIEADHLMKIVEEIKLGVRINVVAPEKMYDILLVPEIERISHIGNEKTFNAIVGSNPKLFTALKKVDSL